MAWVQPDILFDKQIFSSLCTNKSCNSLHEMGNWHLYIAVAEKSHPVAEGSALKEVTPSWVPADFKYPNTRKFTTIIVLL